MGKTGLKYVRTFALVGFLLAILSVGADWASEYNDSVRETQYRLGKEANGEIAVRIYGDWGDPRKWQRLILVILTLGGWLFLLKPRTAIISAIIYGISIFIFVLWISRAIRIFSGNWNLFSERPVGDLLMLAGNPFDYLLLSTITLLFLTQLFLLARSFLIDSTERNP